MTPFISEVRSMCRSKSQSPHRGSEGGDAKIPRKRRRNGATDSLSPRALAKRILQAREERTSDLKGLSFIYLAIIKRVAMREDAGRR